MRNCQIHVHVFIEFEFGFRPITCLSVLVKMVN